MYYWIKHGSGYYYTVSKEEWKEYIESLKKAGLKKKDIKKRAKKTLF